MRQHGLLILIAVFALAGEAVSPDDKARSKTDNEKLQGTWKLTRMEVGGQLVEQEKLQEIGDLIVKGDRVRSPEGRDPAKESCWRGKFELDTAKKPRQITIIDEGPDGELRFRAIYSLDGDDLRICLNEDGTSIETPTSFQTKADSPFMTFIFKREKP